MPVSYRRGLRGGSLREAAADRSPCCGPRVCSSNAITLTHASARRPLTAGRLTLFVLEDVGWPSSRLHQRARPRALPSTVMARFGLLRSRAARPLIYRGPAAVRVLAHAACPPRSAHAAASVAQRDARLPSAATPGWSDWLRRNAKVPCPVTVKLDGPTAQWPTAISRAFDRPGAMCWWSWRPVQPRLPLSVDDGRARGALAPSLQQRFDQT